VKAVKGKVSDSKAMVQAMRKADYDSIRGRYKFNVNHHPIQNFYLLRAVKGGQDGAEMKIEKKVFDSHKDSYYQDCKMKW
jgi:branched-chain amino acid transport system substrate-binding protein